MLADPQLRREARRLGVDRSVAQARFDSRPLVLRRAYTATMRTMEMLPWRDQMRHSLHLFFVIAASVVGKSVANQQVLDSVGPEVLGSLYITVALVAGGTVATVGWLVRNRDTRAVVAVVHAGVALSMALAFLGAGENRALAIATYVAMELNATLLLLVFGLMLGASLGPREARQVAARVGAGGIIGGLLGGTTLSLGAPLLGSRTLFLVAGVFALVPLFALPRLRAHRIRLALGDTRNDRPEVAALKPYGVWVAATTLLMVATTTVVDYQFRYVAESHFDADGMTSFFGVVIIFAGVVTIFFQVTFLDRLLDRLGLFATALIMPLALSAGVLVFGLFPTLTAMAVLKVVDSSSNMSVQQATGGLLLAPLGVRARAVWQGRIDGFARRGGQAMTGLFLAFLPLDPQRLVPVTLGLCVLWIAALVGTRRRYVRLLTAMLSLPTARQPEVRVYDGETLRWLEKELRRAPPERAGVILDLLENAGARAPNDVLERLAHGQDPTRGAMMVVDHLACLGDVAGLVRYSRNGNPDVAGAALLALEEIDFQASQEAGQEVLKSPETSAPLRALAAGLRAAYDPEARALVMNLAKNSDPTIRHAAAQALARIQAGAPTEIGDTLCELAKDTDNDIAREALAALGKHLSATACAVCLQALHRNPLRGAAMRALADLGTPVVQPIALELKEHLDQPRVAAPLTWALGHIGSGTGIPPLVEALSASHAGVRLSAAVALTTLHHRRPSLEVPSASIEARYLPEIWFHGRMREARRCNLPNSAAANLLRRTLRQRGQASLETLFRLLSLSYPTDAIQGAFQGLVARERPKRHLALELLDTVLSKEVSTALAEAMGEGQDSPPVRDRARVLKELTASRDSFVAALANVVLHEIEDSPAGERKESMMAPAHVAQILELQSIALFEQASAEDLSEVADMAIERLVTKGTVLFREGDPGDAMYLVREGRLSMRRGDEAVGELGPGDAAGIVAILDRLPRELTAVAVTSCSLLVIRGSDLQQLLADRPLLMHSVFRALTTSIRDQLDRLALGRRGNPAPERVPLRAPATT